MPLYQRGSTGPEVERIQDRLQDRGHYHGPLDGIYGGGTESAVRAFQRAAEIQVDGIVGPQTWEHLFEGEEISEPAILDEPLDYRSLALTGSFETGTSPPDCFAGLSGDFDGQGISFGALQWNLGQKSLQPLLEQMDEQHPEVMEEVFADHYSELKAVLDTSWEEQMNWARAVQDRNRSVLYEPWRGLFRSLGRREEFQDLQVDAARQLYGEAVDLAGEYGLSSERAVALMFDIKVQNGSIPRFVEQQIRRDIATLPEEEDEQARLCILANRRAEASKPRWVEDVRTRKLTIATGRGTVHGMHYELDQEYGIRLAQAI